MVEYRSEVCLLTDPLFGMLSSKPCNCQEQMNGGCAMLYNQTNRNSEKRSGEVLRGGRVCLLVHWLAVFVVSCDKNGHKLKTEA